MIKLLTILPFLISVQLFSQPAVQSLSNYFADVRSGKSPNIPQQVYKHENAKAILTALSDGRGVCLL